VVIASRKKSFAAEDASKDSMEAIRRALVQSWGFLGDGSFIGSATSA
jgi:hypothetical protein